MQTSAWELSPRPDRRASRPPDSRRARRRSRSAPRPDREGLIGALRPPAQEDDEMSPITRWPNGAQLAMSLVVNVEEGSEMSPSQGDRAPEAVDELGVVLKKPIRNFGNESNYQYGIKAGAPRVMTLLAGHGIRA